MSSVKEDREKFVKWLGRKDYDADNYPKTLVNKLFKLYQQDSRSGILNYLAFHQLDLAKRLKALALEDMVNLVPMISKTDATKHYTKEFVEQVLSTGLTFESPYKRNAIITMFFQGVLEKLWVDGGYVKVENTVAKEAARKAVETKTAKLISLIDSLAIKVPLLERKALLKQAIDRNFYRSLEFGYDINIPNDEASENRMLVNHIRHNLTKYDSAIHRTFGKVGKQTGIRLLRTKIYCQIALTYPFLKDECQNQMERRYTGGSELFLTHFNVIANQRTITLDK